MGVKNLWDIVESCKKTLPLHHLQNKRVCIDLSCWIVQLNNVNKSHCAMTDKLYLRGLFHRLRALMALNCSIIFVADGSIPAIKLSTYRRRLNLANEVCHEEIISHNQSSVRRNMGSEFSCMIKEAKLLGVALGIPCIDGIEEAEAQCALLDSESLCDGCFTSDSDAFLFGARTVYRDICLGEGGYVVCYEMDDIERKLGYGRNSLITLALLLGGDYSSGVHGIGRESACRIVKSVGDSAILQLIASEGLSFAKKPKGLKKQGQTFTSDQGCDPKRREHDLRSDNHYMEVITAYLKPKCHSADSDAVRRALSLYPFKRQQLQQICTQYFGWPPEKTDEYIIPKIAERDLRRYANLRRTSSELGVSPSMDAMPIKCPVSDIVKQKKLRGIDYFEVSWEERDGLETSVVPADLLERACPEKIQEFQDRRAQAKKPKSRRPRQKKAESSERLNEVNLKFEKLVLDVEHEDTTIINANRVGGSTSVDIGDVALLNPANQARQFDAELESNKGRISCSFTSTKEELIVNETEVIDLLSPSPKLLARHTTKVQKSNVECIDIIELSESENEMSPEHEQRARDLRFFIASIKDDVV